MDGQPTRRRNTRQRRLVLDAVHARDDHPTAEDIYNDVHAVDGKISRGTVYRNLNLLDETGAISSVKTPGAVRFDGRTDAHSHVTCRVCGAVVDAPMPYDSSVDAIVASETGFSVDSHSIMFEGVCPACRARHLEDKAAGGAA